MPHCQNCFNTICSHNLTTDPQGCILCATCASSAAISSTSTSFLSAALDYEFSYSKKTGLKAAARLGKAEINLHIPQEELIKVFG